MADNILPNPMLWIRKKKRLCHLLKTILNLRSIYEHQIGLTDVLKFIVWLMSLYPSTSNPDGKSSFSMSRSGRMFSFCPHNQLYFRFSLHVEGTAVMAIAVWQSLNSTALSHQGFIFIWRVDILLLVQLYVMQLCMSSVTFWIMTFNQVDFILLVIFFLVR